MRQAARAMNRDMPLDFCHSMVGVPMLECNAMIQELYGPKFSMTDAWRIHDMVRTLVVMPNYYLNSYAPLVSTAAGRKAWELHELPPFIDGSIRREPDLEHEFPSISCLCRAGKLTTCVAQSLPAQDTYLG